MVTTAHPLAPTAVTEKTKMCETAEWVDGAHGLYITEERGRDNTSILSQWPQVATVCQIPPL